MSHNLALDSQSVDSPDGEITESGYRALCSCGYVGRWFTDVNVDDAETAAVEDGTDHLCAIA